MHSRSMVLLLPPIEDSSWTLADVYLLDTSLEKFSILSRANDDDRAEDLSQSSTGTTVEVE